MHHFQNIFNEQAFHTEFKPKKLRINQSFFQIFPILMCHSVLYVIIAIKYGFLTHEHLLGGVKIIHFKLLISNASIKY